MSTLTIKRTLRTAALLLAFITSIGGLTSCNNGTPDITETDSATDTEVESPTETETHTDPLLEVPAATQFTVSNVFSDNMVVQRNEHVRVWGWADDSQNGKRVSGTFLNTTAHTVIENGEWVLTFKQTWDANTAMGNHMTIYGDGVEYTFSDVLVGDVYMAIGQSNIWYSMETHLKYASPKKHGTLDENALIRLHFNSQDQREGYPTWGTEEVCREIVSDSRWELPTEENYLRFSALGYYFAENMLKANGNTVPIGVIEVEAAGKHLACFLSNEVATTTQADTLNPSSGVYTASGANGKAPSRFVYNQYIYPFEKYAISGIIWYQGESDLHDENTRSYADKFVPLMQQMRETHNVLNKEFPLYIMELARCYDGNWTFGGVRAIQGGIAAQQLPNTYLVPSSDLIQTRPRDVLHPDIKWEQAERLAAIAAAVEYKQGTPDKCLGPVLRSIELSSDGLSAVLTFDNVGDGLKTINGADTVTGFQGYNAGYVPLAALTATITAPNEITVTSAIPFQGVGYNTAVTNGFGTKPTNTLNLCNSFDVPAGAFVVYPTEEP